MISFKPRCRKPHRRRCKRPWQCQEICQDTPAPEWQHHLCPCYRIKPGWCGAACRDCCASATMHFLSLPAAEHLNQKCSLHLKMNTDVNTALTSLVLLVPTVAAFFSTLSLTGGYHYIDWDCQWICLGCGIETMPVLNMKKDRKEAGRASTLLINGFLYGKCTSNK